MHHNHIQLGCGAEGHDDDAGSEPSERCGYNELSWNGSVTMDSGDGLAEVRLGLLAILADTICHYHKVASLADSNSETESADNMVAGLQCRSVIG